MDELQPVDDLIANAIADRVIERMPTEYDDAILASLHRLEAILETIAVDIEIVATEATWRRVPFYERWFLRRKADKRDMVLGGSESNADGLDPRT